MTDLGEARDQEAKAKARALPDARWHFLGRLQRNKAGSVAAYTALLHSLDRPELVTPLANGVRRRARTMLMTVVPPPQPIVWPGWIRPAAAAPMRRFSARCVSIFEA